MQFDLAWEPTANIASLKKRAEIIKKIRAFFEARDVLEVETPLLASASGTDPQITTITANLTMAPLKLMYLQTSPEFAMKRLLATGIGAIYQITKAFRDEERGRYHNPEFTMLEWYRPGFDHHQLMLEMDALLQRVLNCQSSQKYSYQAIFEKVIGCNPHELSASALQKIAHTYGLEDILGIDTTDKDIWLQRLMSEIIEPTLIGDTPFFIYDYPASQAALSKVRQENYALASRFEVYYQGIELANGFHELTDAQEQAQRFLSDLAYRKTQGLESIPMDKKLLTALAAGLPDCSGVALGIDRLVMLALNFETIDAVIAFPFERV